MDILQQKEAIALIILFMIICFEVYFIYSEESHHKFFDYVGLILIILSITCAYLLFNCLNLKTKQAKNLTIDKLESNYDRRQDYERQMLDRLLEDQKFKIFKDQKEKQAGLPYQEEQKALNSQLATDQEEDDFQNQFINLQKQIFQDE